MDIEKLKRQLAREALEYLADIRAIRDELRSAEGWMALGLIVLAVVITIAWAIVSLGFSPPNEHVTRWINSLGLRLCKPVSNLQGVIIFVNLFVMLFLTVISIGNMLIMIGRMKRGWPKEPRDLIISTTLMVTVGIGGIIFMQVIC
jgi:hypothetical protein